MLSRQQGQRGVSLMELLVSMASLAILLAAGAPSFAQFIQNRKVRTAAESIVQGLQLAKAEAVRRNTFVAISIGADSGWTVQCIVPGSPGTTVAGCPDPIQSRPAREGSVGVTADATNLAFDSYGKASQRTTNTAVNIRNPGAGTCEAAQGSVRCLRVIVSATGQIRMCDPKLTADHSTSPEAC